MSLALFLETLVEEVATRVLKPVVAKLETLAEETAKKVIAEIRKHYGDEGAVSDNGPSTDLSQVEAPVVATETDVEKNFKAGTHDPFGRPLTVIPLVGNKTVTDDAGSQPTVASTEAETVPIPPPTGEARTGEIDFGPDPDPII